MKKELKPTLMITVRLSEQNITMIKHRVWQIAELAKVKNLGQSEVDKLSEQYFSFLTFSE